MRMKTQFLPAKVKISKSLFHKKTQAPSKIFPSSGQVPKNKMFSDGLSRSRRNRSGTTHRALWSKKWGLLKTSLIKQNKSHLLLKLIKKPKKRSPKLMLSKKLRKTFLMLPKAWLIYQRKPLRLCWSQGRHASQNQSTFNKYSKLKVRFSLLASSSRVKTSETPWICAIRPKSDKLSLLLSIANTLGTTPAQESSLLPTWKMISRSRAQNKRQSKTLKQLTSAGLLKTRQIGPCRRNWWLRLKVSKSARFLLCFKRRWVWRKAI